MRYHGFTHQHCATKYAVQQQPLLQPSSTVVVLLVVVLLVVVAVIFAVEFVDAAVVFNYLAAQRRRAYDSLLSASHILRYSFL